MNTTAKLKHYISTTWLPCIRRHLVMAFPSLRFRSNILSLY
uniref:Uncharacterized protein n=1 Tax=Arundo donax TaxID=35708 RepID=A0A0A8YWN6_ARUDO